MLPVAVILLIVALGLYWELVIAEGAHLGRGVVLGLYDLVAERYDRIKSFQAEVEFDYLGLPLAGLLAPVDQPRVLDVAAGTGRVARALLTQLAFDGGLVCLEPAGRMLTHGRRACAAWPERAAWVRGLACPLPFPDATFDLVTCLEALEFMPDPRAALAEFWRVLRPGGWLVMTNRVGWQAPLIVGHTWPRARFQAILAELELEAVEIQRWQVDYDLAWGRKAK